MDPVTITLIGMLGKGFISSFIRSSEHLYTANKDRELKSNLAESDHKLQMQMEANREDFQLNMHEKNKALERSLLEKSHQFRLEEQAKQFDLLCHSKEWELFLSQWPLIIPPSVVRQEQIKLDGSVCLRVFLSCRHDELFSTYVYPEIEQGLKEFIDLYTNALKSKNILFYQGAFHDARCGSGVNKLLYHALSQLPVLIIEMNVMQNEVCLSLEFWGFGSTETTQMTLFHVPLQRNIKGEAKKRQYYSELARKISILVKFIVGYVYDIYNLVENNVMPLFIKAAQCECRGREDSGILAYDEIKQELFQRYEEIYNAVLGNASASEGKHLTVNIRRCKRAFLHISRLDYAIAVQPVSSDEKYADYLYESLTAWLHLRTSRQPEEFLQAMLQQPSLIKKYFAAEDVTYFFHLTDAFRATVAKNRFGYIEKLIGEIRSLLSPQMIDEDKRIFIDETPYDYSAGYSSQEEVEKYHLTMQASEAIKMSQYEKAAEYLVKNAQICHRQQKEQDAYWLEHQAFRCRQRDILRRADFDLRYFSWIPYVEILKSTLTRLADQAAVRSQFDRFVFYKRLSASLCRAQRKERDAFLIETSIETCQPASEAIREKYIAQGITVQEQEERIYQDLAKAYEIDHNLMVKP